MAGAIIVSKGKGLSLSSVDFDCIVEKIRRNFPPAYDEIRDKMFAPIDEGGISFISLIECDDRAIKLFQEAVNSAHREELEVHACQGRLDSWQHLISLLQEQYEP